MHRANREDVARAAGVSKTTVTYVLNDTPGIQLSARTRTRVKRVAAKLGYQPNFAATSLVQRRTDIVGILLPSQQTQFGRYYSRMIAGLIEAAANTPYHFLYLGMDHPEKYRQCMVRGYAAGVVILQSDADRSHIAAVRAFRKPVVTMNYLNDLGCPQVSMDYEQAVDKAYEFMAARGRKRVAFVCARKNCQPNIRHIARHHELVPRYRGRTEFVHLLSDDFPSLPVLVAKLAAEPAWDGLVVDGADTGAGIERGMAAAGRRTGEQFDLVVFDTGDPRPPLSPKALLLDAQPEEVGKAAWDAMHALLDGKRLCERTILIPWLECLGQGGTNR